MCFLRVANDTTASRWRARCQRGICAQVNLMCTLRTSVEGGLRCTRTKSLVPYPRQSLLLVQRVPRFAVQLGGWSGMAESIIMTPSSPRQCFDFDAGRLGPFAVTQFGVTLRTPSPAGLTSVTSSGDLLPLIYHLQSGA